MNTKSVKKTKLWIILISLFVVIEVLLIGATLAWFTDQKSSSATLKFGVIELDDTGSNATGLAVSIARGETTLTSEEAIMPGDKVDININVKLKTTSQPAYYLVYLEHDELFGDKEFFFKTVTKTAATDETSETVYATDGTKIYQVSETGTIDDGTESTEVAGKISGGETHTLAFTLTIDETATTLPADKEISCTVYAIQQANLTAKQAYDEIVKQTTPVTFGTGMALTYDDEGQLTVMSALPSWKQAIKNVYGYQTIGFYFTGQQPSTLSLNEELTSKFDEKQAENNLETGKIKVYTNGTTELGFVSDYKIVAPVDSSALFGWVELEFAQSEEDLNLDDNLAIDSEATYSFNFDNFYVDNVTNMSYMFSLLTLPYEKIDLSGWDVSNVTNMYGMFEESTIGDLNLSGWDVSNAPNMVYMLSCAANINMSNWKVGSNLKEIINKLGLSGAGTVNLAGWDTSEVTDMSSLFVDLSFASLDLTGWDTSNVTNMSSMFSGCSKLTSLTLTGWDTSNVTNMSSMFSGCSKLTSLTLTGWDTSNVTNMSSMFACDFNNSMSKLTGLDLSGWDTSNVTDMSKMFYFCGSSSGTFGINGTGIKISSNFVTSNVTNISQMFCGCRFTSLDLSGWDTSNITDMSCLFGNGFNQGCYSTTLDLSGWDTSNVTNMSSMFYGCSALTSITFGDSFDTSNVTDMGDMFHFCLKLTDLNLSGFDTSNVTNMSWMFSGESSYPMKLRNLNVSGWDTSNVTNMGNMFSYCSYLEKLDLSGFDTSSVTIWSEMFFTAFSNISSNGELIIGNNFTYDTTSKTQFTKATLKSATGLCSSYFFSAVFDVKVIKNEVEITE